MLAWIRSSRFRLALVVGLLAVLVLFVLWFFEVFSFLWVAPPPSWNGVVPGQTTLRKAAGLLGAPDRVERRGGVQVYIYHQPDRWGWETVELWAGSGGDDRVVFGVLRTGPNMLHPEYRALIDVPRLQELAQPYGRPDQVMWGGTYGVRYLIWAQKGVSALVGTFDGFNSRVDNILLFPPRGVRGFFLTATFWSWPERGQTWSYVMPPSPEDAPDTLPQDPYDWRALR